MFRPQTRYAQLLWVGGKWGRGACSAGLWGGTARGTVTGLPQAEGGGQIQPGPTKPCPLPPPLLQGMGIGLGCATLHTSVLAMLHLGAGKPTRRQVAQQSEGRLSVPAKSSRLVGRARDFRSSDLGVISKVGTSVCNQRKDMQGGGVQNLWTPKAQRRLSRERFKPLGQEAEMPEV